MTQTTGRALACARCGAAFRCGIDAPGGCWCAQLPVLPAEARIADADCLCEKCLRAATTARGQAPDVTGERE